MIGSQLDPGIAVHFGRADPAIPCPVADLPLGTLGRFVADRHLALLDIFGVARFAVEHGRNVTVERLAGPSSAVDAWLQGSVRAVALAQRGLFALHANTVDIEGTTVAISGPREAGKSTAALRLGQLGHAVIADDIAPLVPADGGAVKHQAVARPPRISPDTAVALGLDVAGAITAPNERKLVLPAPSASPGRVGIVVALRAAATESVTARSLRPAAAVAAIQADAYRLPLLQPVWQSDLFDWAAAIASRVPVVLVTRPTTGWTADAVARIIEQAASERGPAPAP